MLNKLKPTLLKRKTECHQLYRCRTGTEGCLLSLRSDQFCFLLEPSRRQIRPETSPPAINGQNMWSTSKDLQRNSLFRFTMCTHRSHEHVVGLLSLRTITTMYPDGDSGRPELLRDRVEHECLFMLQQIHSNAESIQPQPNPDSTVKQSEQPNFKEKTLHEKLHKSLKTCRPHRNFTIDLNLTFSSFS